MTAAHEKVQALLATQEQKADGTTVKSDGDKKHERFEAGKLFAIALLKEKKHFFWDMSIDRWFEYINGAWYDFAPHTMQRQYLHALPTADHFEGFKFVLYDPAHKRDRSGQTFDFDVVGCATKRPHLINRAVIDSWLQPAAGEVHPAFGWLLDTLSSGRQAERDHIEQCIYWKHKNPGEFQMPALVLFGGAGNGKGVLSEHLLKTVFSSEHCKMITGGASRLLKFQDSLAGAVLFVFDEANFRETSDNEFLKATVQKEEVQIEPKGQKPYTAKMQTWFHIFNNNPLHSPVPVAGNEVDRRYSFIRTRKVLWHAVAEAMDMGPVVNADGSTNDEVKARALEEITNLRENVFAVREQVAPFLQYLYDKWDGVVTSCPMAFHGEDYQALLNNAQTTEDAVLTDVFLTDDGFNNISAKALFKLYQHYAQEEGIRTNFQKTRKKFLVAAFEFIDRKKLDIKYGKQQRYKNDGERKPNDCFIIATRGPEKVMDTDDYYDPETFEPMSAEDRLYNATEAKPIRYNNRVTDIAKAIAAKRLPGSMS